MSENMEVPNEAVNDVSDVSAEAHGKKGGKVKGGKNKAEKKYQNLGSSIAFTKSITVSNGAMSGCVYDTAVSALKRGESFPTAPIDIKTVSGRTARKDVQADGVEDKKDSTLYKGDEATLPVNTDSVYIVFELSVRNAVSRPHSISAPAYLRLMKNGFFDRVKRVSKDVFLEIANNVFSGSWAWRNAEEASEYEISVVYGEQSYDDSDALSEAMYAAFISGHSVHFQVRGIFKLGTGSGSTPVFPSQLMDTGKPKRFFELEGPDHLSVPALRGVKIGNRLREMDVWYRNYADYQTRLPVEPLGYSMWLSTVLREPDETLPYYLNEILGDNSDMVLNDDKVMRFVCGNVLFGCLVTEKTKEN